MKLLLLAALVAVAFAHPVEISENDLKEWENFKVKYEKNYETSEEELKRKGIFMDRLNFIREHNAKYEKGEVTYTVGINSIADLTKPEITSQRKGLKMPGNYKRSGREFVLPEDAKVSRTVDWRNLGAVTPVKDQGQCGSCWSFSTTGSLEGQHFLATKKLVSLSEQNLVDCSGKQGNQGCNGGWPDWAFNYIISNKGIDTEASYGYKGYDESCNYNANNSSATMSSYVDIKSGDEEQLKQAVATIGPISVCIDANHDGFSYYSSGVYNEPDCMNKKDELDHCVLAVGYGTHWFKDYWLVKNSWGTDWGKHGYIMMSRNKNNQCGIATQASYPVL